MSNYNNQRPDSQGGSGWSWTDSNGMPVPEGMRLVLGVLDENGEWTPVSGDPQLSAPWSLGAQPQELPAANDGHIDDQQPTVEHTEQRTPEMVALEQIIAKQNRGGWGKRFQRGVGVFTLGVVAGGAVGGWAINTYRDSIYRAPVVRSVLEGVGGLPEETAIQAEIGTKDIVIAYLDVNAPGEATLKSTIAIPNITDVGKITEALLSGNPFPTHEFDFTDSYRVNPSLEEANGVRLAYALNAQELHVDAVKDADGDLRDVVVTVPNNTVKAIVLQNDETNSRHAKSQAETGLAVGRTAFNNGSKTILDSYRLALGGIRGAIPDFMKTPAIDKFLEEEDKKLQSFVDNEAAKNNVLHNAALISQARIAEAMAMDKFSELPEVEKLVKQLVQQEAAMRLGAEFQTWVDPGSVEVSFSNNDGNANQIVFTPNTEEQQATDEALKASLKELSNPLYTGGVELELYTPTQEEVAKIATTFDLVNVTQKESISIVEEPVR